MCLQLLRRAVLASGRHRLCIMGATFPLLRRRRAENAGGDPLLKPHPPAIVVRVIPSAMAAF